MTTRDSYILDSIKMEDTSSILDMLEEYSERFNSFKYNEFSQDIFCGYEKNEESIQSDMLY